MSTTYEVEVGGRTLSFEIGRMAFQASGAVVVRYGETAVLVTAVMSDRPREGIDFLPLTCDYLEMAYAAGRIPGGFFRREIGRPSEKETLTSRLIDRPLRPLFPKGQRNEIQVIATVLSSDLDTDSDIPALNGAAAAVEISDIPFQGPVAAVRVGKVDGKLIVNPTNTQLKDSRLNLIVAGAPQGLVMVEGGARMASEDEILEALFFAQEQIQPIISLISRMREEIGNAKQEPPPPPDYGDLPQQIADLATDRLLAALSHAQKQDRRQAVDQVREDVLAELGEAIEGREKDVVSLLGELKKKLVREKVLQEKRRVDGRTFAEVRPITCEIDLLSRTHGSALFSRGETRAHPRTSNASKACSAKPSSPSCCTIISRPTPWVKPGSSGARGGGRSGTAPWPNGPFPRSCPMAKNSPTPSGWSQKSCPATALPPWRRSVGPAWP